MARTEWRKSSYSGGGHGNCVEVSWRKSSYSGAGNGDCVEVKLNRTHVALRDSKNATGPTLAFPRASWRTFLSR